MKDPTFSTQAMATHRTHGIVQLVSSDPLTAAYQLACRHAPSKPHSILRTYRPAHQHLLGNWRSPPPPHEAPAEHRWPSTSSQVRATLAFADYGSAGLPHCDVLRVNVPAIVSPR